MATTADNIVAIGTYAAPLMTTATDQVIVGTFAGRCVLTCAGNTVVGAHAFYNECAGSYNTVLGNCAGFCSAGATTNIFIGAEAGGKNTTGSANVFVGYKAGCANTTGSCCLVIGNGTCDLITGDFNGGCVGIGTATPQTSLHVAGANDKGTIIVSSTLDVVNCWNGIEFGYSTVRKAGIFFERTCNNYVGKLHFATENTQDHTEVDRSDAKMTINEAGMVGIGTTAPDKLLTVQGDTNVADGYGLIVGYCEQLSSSVQTWETQILGTAAADTGMALFAFSTGTGPSVNFLRSREPLSGRRLLFKLVIVWARFHGMVLMVAISGTLEQRLKLFLQALPRPTTCRHR